MSDRENFIQDLRDFADWLERTPDAPLPLLPQRFDVFSISNKDELKRACLAIGGKLTKGATESFFYMRKDFRSIHYDINADRGEVCERVVIGTRTIPAEPERTVTVAAQPERVEEITEWRCGEVLK